MDLLVAKVSSVLFMSLTTTIAVVLPLKFVQPLTSRPPTEQSNDRSEDVRHRQEKGNRLTNAMLAFSGGALLATVFNHLMPEVDAEFEKLLSAWNKDSARLKFGDGVLDQSLFTFLLVKIPWAKLTVTFGFFLVFALEVIVDYIYSKSSENETFHHESSAESAAENLSVQYNSIDSSRTLIDSHDSGEMWQYRTRLPRAPTPINFDDLFDERVRFFGMYQDHEIRIRPSDDVNGSSRTVRRRHETTSKFPKLRKALRGLLLSVIMTIHSCSEGMAIGLQLTTIGIWTTFSAVALHKFLLAFGAGVALTRLGAQLKVYFLSVVPFFFLCPIGIAMGTTVTEILADRNLAGAPSLPIASLQGLSCGTLLYATFFEALIHTRNKETFSLVNLLAVFFGLVLFSGLHLLA